MSDVKHITDILMREFPRDAIKRRPGGGNRQLEYLSGDTIIRRLIEATGNQFDVSVDAFTMQGDVAQAIVTLTIPGLGSRIGIGVQRVNPKSEDLVKGVVTDGLKKAATLFGVGLQLYGDDYESDDYQPPRSQSAPPRQPAPAQRRELPQTTPEQKQRGQEMRAVVEGMIADYPDWDITKATFELRGIGMDRWSDITDAMLEEFQRRLDGTPAPPATASSTAPADDSDEGVIAQINAITDSAELAKLSASVVKRYRDREHPVRVRLAERFNELKEAA